MARTWRRCARSTRARRGRSLLAEQAAAELLEVESHREVRAPGGDDEHADRRVIGAIAAAASGQVAPKGAAQRVARFGPIEPERGDVAVDSRVNTSEENSTQLLSIEWLSLRRARGEHRVAPSTLPGSSFL